MWWSLTTVTTVGYGDHFPTVSEGRLIAALLMVVGIGVVGTITASIAGRLLNIQPPLVEDDSVST